MNTSSDAPQDYTASSLAEAAGVHYSHIARLCREGRIPARKFASLWIITYADGQQWIAEREAKRQRKAV